MLNFSKIDLLYSVDSLKIINHGLALINIQENS